VPLDLARVLSALVADGVSAVRLDMASESAERSVGLTGSWREAIERVGRGESIAYPIETTSSSGHYFRALR